MKPVPTPVKWLALVLSLAGIGLCFVFLKEQDAAAGGALVRGLRLGIVAFGLVGWFVSQSLISGRGPKEGPLGDGLHELFAPWHAYLEAHPRAANGVLIASSACIDLLGVFLIAASIFGPSMQPFAALILLFVMRQACQALCALPAPPGMIWRHPGFPSLLVTYDVANDFFFSGHTSIAVLGAIVAAGTCPWWVGALAGVVALGEAAVVLVLRAHYTMDVFAAAVAAFCAHGLAQWLCAAL